MMVSASQAFVSQNNEEVLMYSVNGNISIYAYDMEINGIIYAPRGIVQICGTNIKINGMIIANKIQISADNKLLINQNLNLKNASAFKYYNDELQIFADAEYDDTTEAINVNWESTYDEGKFDIYTSTDDNNYTLLDTVTGVNTYDKTGVLCFSSEVDTYHDLTSNSTILKNVTERIICEEGDPAYDVGIRKAVDKLKVLPQEEYINGVRHVKKRNIVFISDGEGTISQSTLNYAKANNVIINTVALSRSSDYGSNNLFKIADATNGKRFYVLTTNIFINEYNHYGTHSNLDVTTNTDSDQGDTLPDIFEENGMMCTNGEILFSIKQKEIQMVMV